MPGGTLGQTIMVVNKSGKVVSTSKHLVNVFKEAKSAYRERKAEIRAAREEGVEKKVAKKNLESEGRPRLAYDSPPSPRSPASETRTRQESRRHAHKSRHGDSKGERRHEKRGSRSDRRGSHRPPVERGYTDSFYVNDRPRHRSNVESTLPFSFMQEAEQEAKGKELVRRRSFSDLPSSSQSARTRQPKKSNSDIDMDLAYGELPPPLPARTVEEERELKFKVTALQRMLEEANALHHSATAIIKSLENNPDAMAAVALTMAEISNIVAKVGPGALTALKGSFPAVVALLASPEFLIAAGVGVGITVIALGGYKIIKRIKAKKESDKETEFKAEELEEIKSDVDVDRIEVWRRGIADVDSASVGTSVEGELITPGAARDLRAQGKLPELKKSKKSSKAKKEKKAEEADKGGLEKEARRAREKKEKQERKEKKERDEKERKEKKKTEKKQPTGLAMMFKGRKEEDKDLLI